MKSMSYILGSIRTDLAQLILGLDKARKAVRMNDRRTELALIAEQFLELAPDAVVIVDSVGTIEYVNEQAEFLFKYKRDALIGQPLASLMPERFRVKHAQHFANFVLFPRRRRMGTGFELWGLRSDGEEFAVDIAIGPVKSDHGQRYAAIVRDVSALRNAVAIIRQTVLLSQAWMAQLVTVLDDLSPDPPKESTDE